VPRTPHGRGNPARPPAVLGWAPCSPFRPLQGHPVGWDAREPGREGGEDGRHRRRKRTAAGVDKRQNPLVLCAGRPSQRGERGCPRLSPSLVPERGDRAPPESAGRSAKPQVLASGGASCCRSSGQATVKAACAVRTLTAAGLQQCVPRARRVVSPQQKRRGPRRTGPRRTCCGCLWWKPAAPTAHLCRGATAHRWPGPAAATVVLERHSAAAAGRGSRADAANSPARRRRLAQHQSPPPPTRASGQRRRARRRLHRGPDGRWRIPWVMAVRAREAVERAMMGWIYSRVGWATRPHGCC
jgi:hypothetical protein